MKRLAFVLAIVLFLASCASRHLTARKCNGKRGVRTPMGLM